MYLQASILLIKLHRAPIVLLAPTVLLVQRRPPLLHAMLAISALQDWTGSHAPLVCIISNSLSSNYVCFYFRSSIGTFNSLTLQIAITACSSCTAGSYCATVGLAAVTGTCSAGYSCPSGSTNATAVVCLAGSYCSAGAAAPTACAVGKFNPTAGKSLSTDCLACTVGKVCDSAGLAAASGDCPAGLCFGTHSLIGS
jgi:hypothetical protein